jgi:Zn-dependent protease
VIPQYAFSDRSRQEAKSVFIHEIIPHMSQRPKEPSYSCDDIHLSWIVDSSLHDRMKNMEGAANDGLGFEPEIVQAEIVETAPGTPWEWQEVYAARRDRHWKLAVVLFVATCLSVLFVGSMQSGESVGWYQGMLYGLRYAIPLMTILVCHEMGHFLFAHRHQVYASLPYFIPMPLPPFGTFGAVIAMEPRVGGRKAIFDIGISGPLAGLIPTILFLVIGLQHSNLVVPPRGETGFGVPPLIAFLADELGRPIPTDRGIIFSDPMVFAAWVGLFITSLNLIPIGQLDGGHVLYALLRRKAHIVARILLYSAMFFVVLNFKSYYGWMPMLALVFFVLGPIHPPTANDDEPLGMGRTILGWLTLAFVIVGFTRMPIFMPQ